MQLAQFQILVLPLEVKRSIYKKMFMYSVSKLTAKCNNITGQDKPSDCNDPVYFTLFQSNILLKVRRS